MKNTIKTLEERLCEATREAKLFPEIYRGFSDSLIHMEITWGDWKHEHLRLQWFIKENFPELAYIGTNVTEDDGSDTYSARHNFLIIK